MQDFGISLGVFMGKFEFFEGAVSFVAHVESERHIEMNFSGVGVGNLGLVEPELGLENYEADDRRF